MRALRASGGAPAETWRARLKRAAQPIEAKRDQHEQRLRELAARWDAVVDGNGGSQERVSVLEALRAQMLERNYISNLLATIDHEMAEAGLEASGTGPDPAREA